MITKLEQEELIRFKKVSDFSVDNLNDQGAKGNRDFYSGGNNKTCQAVEFTGLQVIKLIFLEG